MLCYRLCEGLVARGFNVEVLTLADHEHHSVPDPGTYAIKAKVIRTLRRVGRKNLILGTIANHRITVSVLRASNPDLILFFSPQETGYQVYHDALMSGIPCLTVMGDTWLSQAWADLPLYDEYVGFSSGRGTGAHVPIKRAIGRFLTGFGLYNGRHPLRLPNVSSISRFLVDSLISAGVDEALVVKHCSVFPVPLYPPYINGDGVPAGVGRMKTWRGLKVICVSRLEPQKGQDDAIRAVALARQDGLDISLTIAGMDRCGYGGVLRQLIEKEGVNSGVTILAGLEEDDLKNLYLSHDLFIFPSRIVEGLGMVCAEAMACGLPVLATTPGGQDDLVVNGETGYRFTPGDVKALAVLLRHCAGGLPGVQEMGLNAMERIRYHAVARVMDDFTRGLESLVVA